jgi:hypothetical protein
MWSSVVFSIYEALELILSVALARQAFVTRADNVGICNYCRNSPCLGGSPVHILIYIQGER